MARRRVRADNQILRSYKQLRDLQRAGNAHMERPAEQRVQFRCTQPSLLSPGGDCRHRRGEDLSRSGPQRSFRRLPGDTFQESCRVGGKVWRNRRLSERIFKCKNCMLNEQ